MTRADPASKNKYCRSTDLSNEASVESFFVLRMLADLGYRDAEIKTKRAIQELRVPKGRSQELYRPDFLIEAGGKPRWLLDAKATDERVEDYAYQCAGYALLVNRKYEEKPLHYFVLTNGLLTRVYVWDQEEAILSLRFQDWENGNTRYEALKRLLNAEAARTGWQAQPQQATGRVLIRPAMDEVKKAFLRCHRIIWKSEKMSPQAAFVGFAKVLFVKLWEDRRLRDNPVLLAKIGGGEPLPPDEVRFSRRWIAEQEANDPNPVDALLFRQLVDSLEEEIEQRKRKRIFEPDERLRLSPGTVKRVVEQLENYYLFGIDEDLNGRMFEAFLAATMRGQALGQYFTPRSIVKVITRLAHLHAGPDRVDRVLDACCGTGGFLIEALTEMRRQIWDNTSLTGAARATLLEEVANQAIFGIDAGRDPMIARIARINMYLHGDGGSRVYMTDALRHPPEPSPADTPEVKNEVQELRGLLDEEVQFDAAITNPPFSMDYQASVPEEKEVLETFELASYAGKRRRVLRSSVMFVERYWDLLKPGGRLLTVIDDSVLGGKKFGYVRDFIRERFIVRAVISLHGDAFQRAGARAKTSILYLTKRTGDPRETQPDAFVYESRYIGLDDVVPRTRASVAEAARTQAAREMDEIVAAFDAFQGGERGPWLVPADRLTGRLDAKYLRPWTVAELESGWRARGVASVLLEDLVEPVDDVVTLDPDKRYTFLRISYAGYAEPGETALGREVSYPKIGRAKPRDIVVSNISAVYKAICVMPPEMADCLTSNEFTVLRLKPGVKADPFYLWSVLRSSAVIAQWISGSSGVGRHRVDWSILRKQRIPLLAPERQAEIGELYRLAQEREAEVRRFREEATEALADLDLESDAARDRLARAKPPK
ncbi:MAG TPA: N-6 DNA methylase [Gemmatimonadales bacterium]|nr:N-6 DNA methylase [Gemmatimonadales bacterium]